VPLVGVLHEELGAKEFMDFFQGPLYLDSEKRFYGPKERRTLLGGFLRFSVYRAIYETAYRKKVPGNLEGDGTLLGSVFVLGPGDTGVLYEHREGYFGDHCNTTAVLEAVEKIAKSK